VRGRVLTADQMTAHNTFDAPTQVAPAELEGASIQGEQVIITLPPMSVVVVELA
jgi:alpha-N-arabinofuranosidase